MQTTQKDTVISDAAHCDFCLNIQNKFVTPSYRDLFPKKDPTSQILAENEDWYLISDDSPMVTYHWMLVSKNHGHSWATVDEKSRESLVPFREQIISFAKTALPEMASFCFEHGSGTLENGQPVNCGSCAAHTHTHLHILLFPQEKIKAFFSYLKEEISRTLNKTPEFLQYDEVISYTLAPYLYIADPDEGAYLYVTDVANACFLIPSQYIRSLAGTFFGIGDEEWDYKKMIADKQDLARSRIEASQKLFTAFEPGK